MAKRQFCSNCKGSYRPAEGYEGYCSESCYNEAEKPCNHCQYHYDNGRLINPMPCAVNPTNKSGSWANCISFLLKGT